MEQDNSSAKIQELNKRIKALEKRITQLEKKEEVSQKIEDTFIEIEERFLMLFKYSPQAIQLHSIDGTLLEANPAWSRLWGLENPEEHFNTYNIFSDPQAEKFGFWKAFRDAIKGNIISINPFFYDPSISGLPGRSRWLHSKIYPVYNGKGDIITIVLSHEDITNVIDAEQKIKQNERRNKSILEAIPDLMFRLNRNGDYLDFHSTKSDYLILDNDKIIGKNINDLIDYEDYKNLCLKYINIALDTHKLQIFEYKLNVRGILYDLEARVVPSGDDEVIAIIRDITEKRKSEQKIIESQKMDSIGNLAGGIAHDFNNMLGGISGYASLLLSREKNPEKRNFLEGILTAVNQSSELTHKLLAFGRKGQNLIIPVNTNKIILEIKAILEHSLNKNITIDLDLDDSLFQIDADPSQINQIIMNLAVNAAESMPDGGKISIKTSNIHDFKIDKENNETSSNDYISISVYDTGSGMDEETRAHIFEPFFTTKKEGDIQGTGLGLATVYGITKNHGGFIEVASEKDKGSVFHIYFPKGIKEQKTDKTDKKPILKGGKGKILIVDDEDLVRNITIDMVSSLGYTVVSAVNGRKALQIYSLDFNNIDVVLLDLKMPVLGGKDTFIEMRKINPNLAVLIVTGFGQNKEAQELLDLGAKGILAKPYRIEKLAEKINQILNR